MDEKLKNLDDSRRDQIVNGALSVFGKHAYDKASTDEIAKAAGISKGLLYHYFESKKELYLELFEWGVRTVLHEFDSGIDPNERDFFRIIDQSVRLKIALMARYPALFDFLSMTRTEQSPSIERDLGEIYKALIQEGTRSLFQNADLDKFRPEFDLARVIEVMGWISDGFFRKTSDFKNVDPEHIIDELHAYMDLFKRATYKEEYLS